MSGVAPIPTPTRLAWRPALDGLRGVAVLLVILVHFGRASWFPGGFVGVDIFFALSGFLITTLILQEWDSTGTVSLRRFYARRALRLLPAACALFAVFLLVVFVFGDKEFTGRPSAGVALSSVAASLGYVLNWVVALDYPYAPALGHVWSLSIEEQYYLVWPVLLLVLLRRGLPRKTILGITLGLALASMLVPLADPDAGPTRMYSGTDVRAQALLLGSALGQLYAGGFVRPTLLGDVRFRLLISVAVAYLTVFVGVAHSSTALLYFGPLQLAVVASTILVFATALAEDQWAARVLGGRVLRYVGRRSYALYLWQWPLTTWMSGLGDVERFAISVPLTFAAAELSYRLVERPALRLKGRFSRPERATDPAPDEALRAA